MVQLFKIPRPLFWSKHNSVSHTTHTHQDSQWSLTLDLTKPNIDITSNLRAHVLYDQSFASLRSPQPSGSAPQQPGVLEKLDRWSYLSIMSDQLRLSTRNQTGWRFWTQRILVKFHHPHKKICKEKASKNITLQTGFDELYPYWSWIPGVNQRIVIKKNTSPANLCVFAYLKPFLVHMSLDRLRTGEQPLWAEVTVGTQLGVCSLPEMTCHFGPLSSAKVWCAICI